MEARAVRIHDEALRAGVGARGRGVEGYLRAVGRPVRSTKLRMAGPPLPGLPDPVPRSASQLIEAGSVGVDNVQLDLPAWQISLERDLRSVGRPVGEHVED